MHKCLNSNYNLKIWDNGHTTTFSLSCDSSTEKVENSKIRSFLSFLSEKHTKTFVVRSYEVFSFNFKMEKLSFHFSFKWNLKETSIVRRPRVNEKYLKRRWGEWVGWKWMGERERKKWRNWIFSWAFFNVGRLCAHARPVGKFHELLHSEMSSNFAPWRDNVYSNEEMAKDRLLVKMSRQLRQSATKHTQQVQID